MIITNINSKENSLFEAMSPKFAKAFEIVRQVLDNPPEIGKYEVEGKDLYYMIQAYDAKSPLDARFESHREYIDVQAVLEGEETIRFESAGKLPPCTEYTFDNADAAVRKLVIKIKAD